MRTALTIAGSDSGGGAGIQADLRTFTAFGVYGTCAVTAITAQNTTGIARVFPLPADLVVAQIEAVVDDLGADAVKIGMLATAEIAIAVAGVLRRRAFRAVVLDPVMTATNGTPLLTADAVAVLRSEIMPLATVTTANVPEAEAFTGMVIRDVAGLRAAAASLVEAGARAALVKGGHLDGPAVDVLYDGHVFAELPGDRIASRHTHGTGCTFAAAVAARLALGDPLVDAAREAKAYVTQAIRCAPGLGHGHGPLGPGFPRP
jgi:hydroxymethylpyrimidine/phosphomethylpyrimidine kinase